MATAMSYGAADSTAGEDTSINPQDRQLDESKRLFLQVERAKHEWEMSVDVIEEGIAVIDTHGIILRANRTLANWLLSAPVALVGKDCSTVLNGWETPPVNCLVRQLLESHGSGGQIEIELPKLSGTFRCITYPLREHNGAYTGAVLVLKNITGEQRMQAQLVQSEKLAATGRMAASLAHEINNPLQAIQAARVGSSPSQ